MGYLDLKSKSWNKGDWTYINKLVWDEKELLSLVDCLAGDWFGGNSKFNKKLEELMVNFTGLKHFQTTNSGSSALEIAVQIFIQTGVWKRGDKILHPGLTFPTSIASAIMAGLVPVYADVAEGTYVISEIEVAKALELHPDIKGAILPALLGNSPHMDKIKELLGDRKLILDSCDVMGTKWDGREVGSYGDFAAYSFYGSHHMSTAGVGGALGTSNDEYGKLAESMAFWGRDFSTDKLDPVENFLRRYSYQTIGLDAQLSAMQAAFGLAQFERLPEFIGERETVYRRVHKVFEKYQDYFILPLRTDIKADVSWFCFPLTLKPGIPFSREFFVRYLVDNKVEIRPIMAGNLTNHLPYSNVPHYVVGDLHQSDVVSRRGFFIPACPMQPDQLENYIQILEAFLRKY